MAVSRYVTLRAIKHSGNDFAAGTPVALSDEYAAPLLAIGAIQAQAGALPPMPTAQGNVVRDEVDTASGGKAQIAIMASPSGNKFSAGGVDISNQLSGAYRQRLLSFAVGNSIAWNGSYGATVANMPGQGSEIAAANALYPLTWINPICTPVALVDGMTAGVDACGTLGFPGEKTDRIFRDLLALGFPAHDAAAFTPELCYMLSLYENDLAWDYDIQGTKARIRGMIAAIRAHYPGIIFHLGTSRADARLTTQSRIAAAMEMRDFMLSLDNGRDVFVSDFWVGSYSDLKAPTAAPLQWTDGVVHPTSAGAWANGRIVAETNKRISRCSPAYIKRIQSPNWGFVGTNAVSQSGYSGSIPDVASLPTTLTGNACVLTAGNPGPLSIKWTPQSSSDSLLIRFNKTTGLPTGRTGGFFVVRVNSGADAIKDIYPQFRLNGTPVITGAAKSQNSGSGPGGFNNGDLLEFVCPPMALPGTFTAVQHNFYIFPAVTGVLIDVDLIAIGYFDFNA